MLTSGFHLPSIVSSNTAYAVITSLHHPQSLAITWSSDHCIAIQLVSHKWSPQLVSDRLFLQRCSTIIFVVFLFSSAHWSDINVFSCQSDIWYKCFDPLNPIWSISLSGICCVCFLLFVICSSWLICVVFLIIALMIVENSALYASNGITQKTRMKLSGIHIFHLQCKNIWATTQFEIKKYG